MLIVILKKNVLNYYYFKLLILRVLIYDFNLEDNTLKPLNFIVNCAMFVACICTIVRNFESKHYNFIGLQNMLYHFFVSECCYQSSEVVQERQTL